MCPQGSRAETYRELESVLWGDESHLQSSEVDRVIAVALEDLRAAQVSLFSLRVTPDAGARPGRPMESLWDLSWRGVGAVARGCAERWPRGCL